MRDTTGLHRVAFVHELGSTTLQADAVIPLTPQAYQDCLRAGLGPTVVDDYIDRRALIHDRSDYLGWQLGWLDRLDLLGANDTGAARAAAQLIKAPIDSLVMAARVLRAALISLRPKLVTYVGVSGCEVLDSIREWDLQFRPLLGDVPLPARLLPIIAKDLAIDYEEVSLRRAEPTLDQTGSPLGDALKWLRGYVGALLTLWSPKPDRGAAPTTLMIWYRGYGARTFVLGERSRGRRVLVIQRGRPVIRILEPRLWGLRMVGEGVDVRPLEIDRSLSEPIENLLREVDAWAGTPGASGILQARLEAFLHRVSPVVDRAADQIVPQLVELGVDRVAAANPSSIEEFATLLAAGRVGSVRRTLCQHGDHVFPFDSWLASETHNFDELACSDHTVPGDLTEAARLYKVKVPRFAGTSPRVEEMRRRDLKRATRDSYEALPVCYVPTMFVGDHYVFDGSYFDDAWYHRWQLRLLDLMISHRDTSFIWKALPASNLSTDPIPQILRQRGIRNVVYETRPFQKVLPRVGRVLTDFASTALYEAVHFEKPILALYFPRFADIRASTKMLFGAILEECRDEAEGLGAVDRFVRGDPFLYVLPRDLLHRFVS